MNRYLTAALFIMTAVAIILAAQTERDSECVVEIIHGAPTVTETPVPAQTAPPAITSHMENAVNPFPLNLNTAEKDALTLLPGIGEVLAERIIALRLERGGFSSVEELSDVRGIGEKTLDGIWGLVYTDSPSSISESAAPPVKESNSISITSAVTTAPNPICPVDLNTATHGELCALPGINSEMADRILALREKIHYFSNIRELLYVEGFSDSMFVAVMDYIYVGEITSGVQ